MDVPVLSGRDVDSEGRIFPSQPVTLIGRSKKADVRLIHPALSRLHAELRLNNGVLSICDRNSRAGICVNGQPSQEAKLYDGDEVDFGPIRFRVVDQYLVPGDKSGLALSLRGLGIQRGQRVLLDSVDLDVPANSLVALLSPSGAGKSTLLKYLAGFFLPRNGGIAFDGQPLTAASLAAYRMHVGYVPQEDLIHMELTARENLNFALRLRMARDLKRLEASKVVDQLLDRLGLTEAADLPVSLLSGGQRKRVNVGLELVSHPRLLLLDEPTAGLDPANELRLVRYFQGLAAAGTTIICATHVLDNLELFDRVIVLADRRIDYNGPPGELLSHYGVKQGCYSALYEHLESCKHQTTSAASAPARPPKCSPGPRAIRRQVAAGKPVTAAAPLGSGRDLTQTAVLFARGLRLLQRDRAWMGLLILQPLLIGGLINLSQMMLPNGLHAFFLFAVVTSIWLGLVNTAREVVRDRAIYLRERLLGVSPLEYLSSKAALFGLIGLLQVALLWGVLRYANLLPAFDKAQLAGWPGWYVMAVLWGVYLAAMLAGLLVSTLSRSQEAAVATLPLILLPQLILTGVAAGACPMPNELAFRPLALLWQSASSSVDKEKLAQDEEEKGNAPLARIGTPPQTRPAREWVLEGCSLLTLSRPGLDLLQTVWPEETSLSIRSVTAIDAAHLLLMLIIIGGILGGVFVRAERSWLERV